MSLVAKYARRNDDNDEESTDSAAMNVDPVEEENKKKREVMEQEAPPPAKKAKKSELAAGDLELPDFFKSSTPEKATSASTGAASSAAKVSSPSGPLVPRQLRHVTPDYCPFCIYITNL